MAFFLALSHTKALFVSQERNVALVIGICGGSGSGKSTLAKALAEELGAPCVSMDHYYLFGEKRPASLGDNYDHPDNIAWEALRGHVCALKKGQSIQRPIHDYLKGPQGFLEIHSAPVVIVEGLLILHDKPLAALFDARLHLETDLEVQLARRLARDAAERGVSEQTTRAMWVATVAPMHRQFVAPQKDVAHASIDSGLPMEQMVELARASLRSILPTLPWPAPRGVSRPRM